MHAKQFLLTICLLVAAFGTIVAAAPDPADFGGESTSGQRAVIPARAAGVVPLDVIQGEVVDMAYLTTGLFNDDPWPDLVFSGWIHGTYIAFGNGDGSFGTAQLLDTARDAAVAAAYLDGDDNLDLILLRDTRMGLFLGRGDGTFAQQLNPSIPYSSDIGSIITGYFNADVNLDVAVRPGNLYFGDGLGHLNSAGTLPTPNVQGFAAADFNLDGYDDLAVVVDGVSGHYLALLLSDGSGSFSVSDQLSTGALGLAVSTGNSMADFNHDGYPDVAIITPLLSTAPRCEENNFFRSVVTICLGDGAGHIASTDTFSVCGTSYHMVVTDVDRDGELDVAISNGSTRELEVFVGDGTGHFTWSFSRSFETDQITFVVATDDLDRDGNPDFIGGGGFATASDNIISLINGAPDPVLSGKAITATGYGAELGLVTPGSYEISRLRTTLGGASHLRRDYDTDGILDEAALDPVSVYGDYDVVIKGMPNAAPGTTFDADVTLSGSMRVVLFKDYPSPETPIVFPYSFEATSVVIPPAGLPTNTVTPTFRWVGLPGAGVTPDLYEFQLDATWDFSSPTLMVDATGLIEPQFALSQTLTADNVYYWRVRWQIDGAWSDYAGPFAAYVTDMLCGDVNGDGGLNVSDITYLVAYLFQGGMTPPNPNAADVDGTGGVNVSDLTWLVAFLFGSGPAPGGCP